MTEFKSRDFLEICRICAKTHDVMVKFFSDTSKSLLLLETINALLPVTVAECDGLPQQVCIICISKLRVCSDLFEECQASESTFKCCQTLSNFAEATEEDDQLYIINEYSEMEFNDETVHDPIVIPLGEEDTQNFNLSCVNDEQKHIPADEGELLGIVITIPEAELPPLASEVTLGEIPDEFPDLLEHAEVLFQNCEKKRALIPETNEAIKAEIVKLKKCRLKPIDGKRKKIYRHMLPTCPQDVPIAAVLLSDQSDTDGSLMQLFLGLIYLNGEKLSDLQFEERIMKVYTNFKTSCIDGNVSSATTSFACFNCKLSFSTKLDMISHFKSDHPKQLHYCSKCNEVVCGLRKDFRKHEMIHKIKPEESDESSLLKTMVSRVDKPIENFKIKSVLKQEDKIAPLGLVSSKCSNYKELFTAAKYVYIEALKDSTERDKIEIGKLSKMIICYCVCCKTSLKLLDRHLLGAHYDQTFYCDFCQNHYKRKSTLKDHILHQHLKSKTTLKCEQCNKFVPSHRMMAHKSNHKYFSQRRKCDYCYQILAIKAWNRHRKINLKIGSEKIQYGDKAICKWHKALPLFPCEMCKKLIDKRDWKRHYVYHKIYGPKCPFVSLYTVLQTLKAHNKNKVEEIRKESEIAWQIKYGDKVGRKLKITKSILNPNKRKRRKINVQAQGKELRSGRKIQAYTCDMCGKCFKKREYITSHIKNHLKIGYRCKYCNKYFYKRSTVESHEALHRGERDFGCPFCSKLFPSTRNMKSHVDKIHKLEHQKNKFLIA